MQAIVNTISSYLPAQIVSQTEDITPVDEESSSSTPGSNKNDVKDQDLVDSTVKLDLNDKKADIEDTDIMNNDSRPDSIRYDSNQILDNAPGGAKDPSIVKSDIQNDSTQLSSSDKDTSLLSEREDPTHYQTNALAPESIKKPIPATLDDPQAAVKEQLSADTHKTDQLRAPNAGLDVISGVANQPTVASSRAVNYTDKDDHSQFVVGNQTSGPLDLEDSSTKIPTASIASKDDSAIQQEATVNTSDEQKVKVPIGDKISGSFEKMVGKMTKNEAKIEHGELKKTGQLQE